MVLMHVWSIELVEASTEAVAWMPLRSPQEGEEVLGIGWAQRGINLRRINLHLSLTLLDHLSHTLSHTL
jgi:hypothetical protein